MTPEKFKAGVYEVVNSNRRTRVRDGVVFPGAKDGHSTGEPVHVHVTGWEQLHRLMACADLRVTGPVDGRRRSGGEAQ